MSQAMRDLKRARDVVSIMAKYGFMIDPAFLAKIPGLSLLSPEPTIAALPRGERVKRVLEELGPTYVKLGQVLSIRPDLLPIDIIDSLRELQKNVAPLPAAELKDVIEGYLGAPLEEHFEDFEFEPIAAASIAQVHRARLRVAGEAHDVVVKVQRPGIREKMEADLSILYWLARLIEGSIAEAGLYRPVAIVREFEGALLQELDFLNEARNILEVTRNFESRPGLLTVPKVYEHVTSQKLLVMGFVEGIRITDIVGNPEYDAKQILDRALEVIFDMIFEDGFFHGDPHPGNVLVTPDGRIGMIDFGLMGRLTRDQRDLLIQLALAVFSRNQAQLTRIVMRIGEVPIGFNRVAFEAGVVQLMDKYLGVDLANLKSENLIRDCLDLTMKHGVRLPPNFGVLARAAATVEGIGRIIYPQFNVMVVGAPYAARLIRQKLDPSKLGTELMSLALSLQQFLTETPMTAARMLDDLYAGRMQMEVKGKVFEKLVLAQRVSSVRLVAIVAAAALTVAFAITIAPFQYTLADLGVFERWPIPIVPVLSALGVVACLALLGLTFLFPRGLRKLEVRRLLFWRR